MRPPNSTSRLLSRNTTVPIPALDNESLRERLLIKDGQSISTRGSLSKCSIRYRDFTEQVLFAMQGKDPNNVDSSGLETVKNELVRELKLHDLEMRKLCQGANAAEAELAFYAATAETTQSSILECRSEIENLKIKLAHEITVRRHCEEYESLAVMAIKRPARLKTEQKLKEIRSQMEDIRERERRAVNELEMREKQFQLLIQSIFDLKSNLKEDSQRAEEQKVLNRILEEENKKTENDLEMGVL